VRRNQVSKMTHDTKFIELLIDSYWKLTPEEQAKINTLAVSVFREYKNNSGDNSNTSDSNHAEGEVQNSLLKAFLKIKG